MLANVQLQLVSYHMANHLRREIDTPRNLAKTVIMEYSQPLLRIFSDH